MRRNVTGAQDSRGQNGTPVWEDKLDKVQLAGPTEEGASAAEIAIAEKRTSEEADLEDEARVTAKSSRGPSRRRKSSVGRHYETY